MKRLLTGLLVLACMISVCGCSGSAWRKGSKKPTAEQVAASLAECAEEFELENALSELTLQNETTVDGDTFFRFQQNYQGLPVYGRSVVYVADSEGRGIATSSNVSDISKNFSTTPTLSESEAIDAASGALAEELGEGECSAPVCDLCIFNLSGAEDRLAYWICANYYTDTMYCYEVIVDAENGKILHYQSTVAAENDTGYTASDTEKKDGFPVWKEDDDGKTQYYLADTDLGISVRTFKNKKSKTTSFFGKKSRHFYGDEKDFSTPVVSEDNIFGNGKEAELHYEDAVRLMRLVSRLQTHMQDNFGFQTMTGKTLLYIDDGYDGGKNALGGRDFLKNGLISVGKVTGVDDVDVICHEYGHVISFAIVSWTLQTTENAAINEAFSDIFGELMESKLCKTDEPNWLHTNDNRPSCRDLIEPKDSGNYEKVSDIGTKTNEDQYTLSTIISHAFYLMWNGGIDGNENKKLSEDQLLKLWYRTLLLLSGDADFSACRTMTELAARSLHLSDSQMACVAEAFDEVGIRKQNGTADYTTPCTFILTVLDQLGQAYNNYSYRISGTPAKDGQESFVRFVEETETVFTSDPQKITLAPGFYTITIRNNSDEPDPFSFTVKVEKNGKTNEVQVIADYAAAVPVDRNKLYLEVVESISRSYGYGSDNPYKDCFRGRLIDVDADGEDELLMCWFDQNTWAIDFGLWDIRGGEAISVYKDNLCYMAGGGPNSYLFLHQAGIGRYSSYGETFTGTKEWKLQTIPAEGQGMSSIATEVTETDMEGNIPWDERKETVTYYLDDQEITEAEYKALDFVDVKDGIILAFQGFHLEDGTLELDALEQLLGKMADMDPQDGGNGTNKKYKDVPEPYATFLRDEKNVKNRTGYCLYDIDGDGTDELLLSGSGFGATTYE